jgi:glycogen debranching enzyme
VARPWTANAPAAFGVGTGTITLVEGPAFCISERSGDVVPKVAQGLFFRDTRFLSTLRLLVNGHPPELLSAATTDPFSAVFVLRAPPEGQAEPHVMLLRRRYVGQGMREDLTVRNFGAEPAFVSLEVAAGSDFADLFEVKHAHISKAGELTTTPERNRLVFSYRQRDFRRGTVLSFSEPPHFVGGSAFYEMVVPPQGDWSTCIEVTPVIDAKRVTPRYRCGRPVERATPVTRLERWRRRLPRVTSEHEDFQALLERSGEDLAALRLFDPGHPDRAVVAAGAPWYMTLFGRDSLVTSWMASVVDTDLALGTLQTLTELQGQEVNPITEEEPGRVPHEVRHGELATAGTRNAGVYYGSVDATPLFVMVLGELRRWGDRPQDVDELLPAADRALEWIDKFGDRDGDGYVEYQRATNRGLQNQSWKDAWDAIRFADGTLAQAPISTCEVQGYVYAAWLARAHFAAEHGDRARAATLRARAAELKRRFNQDFWLDEQEWFALGLDRDKRPIDVLASNMGHCLWSGIVDEEKAPIVAKHLLSEPCFSGWGVRTLASTMVGYNPVSYQNGSVWPHDNAICAAGLMRYGLVEEAHRVIEAIVDAAPFFDFRLPELFAGVGRDEVEVPVAYPTACSPQAWASASAFLLLRTVLRLEPDVRNAVVHLAPAVPDWVGRLTLERIPIMGGRLSIEVEGDRLHVNEQPAGLQIVRTARRPTG